MNPSFDTTAFHAAAEQVLSAQKSALDYQRSQVKLAREQHIATIGLVSAGWDNAADFWLSTSKTMVAAFAPKPAADKPSA